MISIVLPHGDGGCTAFRKVNMTGLFNQNLISILQTAIGPVILISGIGLLLLSMTNRLGRVIDRARDLADTDPKAGHHIQQQLAILWQRARLLRLSILLASTSVLCVALMIIVLFLSMWIKVISYTWLIAGLFMASMVMLIVSLIAFIQDVNETLAALKLTLDKDEKKKRR